MEKKIALGFGITGMLMIVASGILPFMEVEVYKSIFLFGVGSVTAMTSGLFYSNW